MVIDTVILKASYDLMNIESALGYSVRKFADDVAKGRSLNTIKMTRFLDPDSRDYLKFNFPICGNLSSADLMLIYCSMNGFNTYSVGNEERMKRNKLICDVLDLKNVTSVPELDYVLNKDTEEQARSDLCFVNTQRRGFAALPNNGDGRLIMEMAADQPLLYNTFRHALDLSQDADIAVNLNAVTNMKKLVPSFIRNGYDKVINSKGEEVVIKENNNFAQNYTSLKKNETVFKMLYAQRNGGGYLSIPHLISHMGPFRFAGRIASTFVRMGKHASLLPDFVRYLSGRKELKHTASYDMLKVALNTFVSPSFTKNRAYVDATNDDIFSCWDMDGLNNDFLGYHTFFERNFPNLRSIVPFAEEVYKVHDALELAGPHSGLTRELEFSSTYQWLAIELHNRIKDQDYLRKMKISDETIDKLQALDMDSFLAMKYTDTKLLEDLESHLKESYMLQFEKSRDQYADRKSRKD